jgi:beta-glucosidase
MSLVVSCALLIAGSGLILGSSPLAQLPASSQACSNGFPSTFIWGLGTAAYQIEGGANLTGRQPSIWDVFSHTPGKVYGGDTGDVACDHLHRFREDVGLMHSIGLQHYRFSISWSRVMSYDAAARTMVPNEAGLAWYDELLSALEAHGIEPYVTLYHWDLPMSLHEHLGGWHTPDNARIVEEFVKYADLCFARYGARVRFWFTFNEPWSFTVEGYDSGKSAPGCTPFQPARGRCAHGSVTPYVVSHNVLVSHAHAVRRFREAYQPKFGGVISITLNCDFSIPASAAAADVAAAERANQFMLGWWLQPLLSGDYPRVMREFVGERLPTFTPEQSRMLVGSADVLAINHYSTKLVSDMSHRAGPVDAYAAWAEDQRVLSTWDPAWPIAESPWLHKYPPGFRSLLAWAASPASSREGGAWPGAVYVTENGWSCQSMSAEAAVRDEEQVAYLTDYTEQMRLAMVEDGVDLRGYFGWSLLDNYEWSDGYSKRFGIFFVDYATQQRTPKAAAEWFRGISHPTCAR